MMIADGHVVTTDTLLTPTEALALIVAVVRTSGYRPLSLSNPVCEGWLPDAMPGAGSRFNAMIPPAVERPTFVIRKARVALGEPVR
jgi:type IV secretory pathway ATPase VirB11/archaellum biosynthesis ATPase